MADTQKLKMKTQKNQKIQKMRFQKQNSPRRKFKAANNPELETQIQELENKLKELESRKTKNHLRNSMKTREQKQLSR